MGNENTGKHPRSSVAPSSPPGCGDGAHCPCEKQGKGKGQKKKFLIEKGVKMSSMSRNRRRSLVQKQKQLIELITKKNANRRGGHAEVTSSDGKLPAPY
jgi:hypothetical protein